MIDNENDTTGRMSGSLWIAYYGTHKEFKTNKCCASCLAAASIFIEDEIGNIGYSKKPKAKDVEQLSTARRNASKRGKVSGKHVAMYKLMEDQKEQSVQDAAMFEQVVAFNAKEAKTNHLKFAIEHASPNSKASLMKCFMEASGITTPAGIPHQVDTTSTSSVLSSLSEYGCHKMM